MSQQKPTYRDAPFHESQKGGHKRQPKSRKSDQIDAYRATIFCEDPRHAIEKHLKVSEGSGSRGKKQRGGHIEQQSQALSAMRGQQPTRARGNKAIVESDTVLIKGEKQIVKDSSSQRLASDHSSGRSSRRQVSPRQTLPLAKLSLNASLTSEGIPHVQVSGQYHTQSASRHRSDKQSLTSLKPVVIHEKQLLQAADHRSELTSAQARRNILSLPKPPLDPNSHLQGAAQSVREHQYRSDFRDSAIPGHPSRQESQRRGDDPSLTHSISPPTYPTVKTKQAPNSNGRTQPQQQQGPPPMIQVALLQESRLSDTASVDSGRRRASAINPMNLQTNNTNACQGKSNAPSGGDVYSKIAQIALRPRTNHRRNISSITCQAQLERGPLETNSASPDRAHLTLETARHLPAQLPLSAKKQNNGGTSAMPLINEAQLRQRQQERAIVLTRNSESPRRKGKVPQTQQDQIPWSVVAPSQEIFMKTTLVRPQAKSLTTPVAPTSSSHSQKRSTLQSRQRVPCVAEIETLDVHQNFVDEMQPSARVRLPSMGGLSKTITFKHMSQTYDAGQNSVANTELAQAEPKKPQEHKRRSSKRSKLDVVGSTGSLKDDQVGADAKTVQQKKQRKEEKQQRSEKKRLSRKQKSISQDSKEDYESRDKSQHTNKKSRRKHARKQSQRSHEGEDIGTESPTSLRKGGGTSSEKESNSRRKRLLKRKQAIAKSKAQQQEVQASLTVGGDHVTKESASPRAIKDKSKVKDGVEGVKSEAGSERHDKLVQPSEIPLVRYSTIISQKDPSGRSQDASTVKLKSQLLNKSQEAESVQSNEIPPTRPRLAISHQNSIVTGNDTTLQQQKDLKILQTCFNLSLNRIQQNYEGSLFLQNKEGSSSQGSRIQTAQQNIWQSPRNPNQYPDTFSNRLSQFGFAQVESAEYSPSRRQEAFPPSTHAVLPRNSLLSPYTPNKGTEGEWERNALLRNKPKTSVGVSRDQKVYTPIKGCEGINDADFIDRTQAQKEGQGKPIRALRDSLQTSHRSNVDRALLIQQAQSLTNYENSVFSTPSIQQQLKSATATHSTINGVPIPGTGLYSPTHLQSVHLKNETPRGVNVRTSIQSSAKQHQFRKQLKLQTESQYDQQHQLILIESGPSGLQSSTPGEQRRGEVTLKAIKMHGRPDFGIVEAASRRNPVGSPNADDPSGQVKPIKIITTQIPQSLLLSSNQRAGGDPSQIQLAYQTRNQQILMQQQMLVDRSTQGGGSLQKMNGFLVPTKQVKGGKNGQNSSMPPSLTAINVQQSQLKAREALQNAQFHSGAFNPGAKSVLPQASITQQTNPRRLVKKKTSSSNFNAQQLKLARRHIQFYQKRNAERHIPPRTGKASHVTHRLLFKRRARMHDQNLLIFYFDGVIGELCSKNHSFGVFKVRYGAFQGLRKLFYKHQIALVLPYVKQRAKVIACYVDKFMGCPVDAIYGLRSDFVRKHSTLTFLDYRQIYEDFDLTIEEKLIDKCLVIAPRTKEVSPYHSNNLMEPVSQPWQWGTETNEPEENHEEQKLLQIYLMNPELAMSARIDTFQFQGCPANLSPMLEPPQKKVNYLQNNEEQPSASAPKKISTAELNAQKEKQTATQANKIAVDLGQKQKPVTLLVPHTRLPTTSNYSFQPIVKVIDDLGVLDEHCKERREKTPLHGLKGRDSLDSGLGAPLGLSSPLNATLSFTSCASQAVSPSNASESVRLPGKGAGSRESNGGANNGQNSSSGKQEPQSFSLIDAFYAFKTILLGQSCNLYGSLLKTLFAVETKKVQTLLYKDSMVGRVLLEKAEIKKCYQYTQQKHAHQADRSAPTQSSHYVQMKAQNEYLKRYIQDYQSAYFQRVKDTMDEAKIMRMTAYFMNQFSQKMVEDQNKKPKEHLREMFSKEINYEKDLPSRNINLFKNHRFLIMVKSTGVGKAPEREDSQKSGGGPSMEVIDIQKIMGPAYFKQLESFRSANASNGQKREELKVPASDLLPADIVRILFNQRHTDCTEWFTKKAFAKPIQLIEKQQVVQERKEQIMRGEQEKGGIPGSGQAHGTRNLDHAMTQQFPSQFSRSHTIENNASYRFKDGGGNNDSSVGVTGKRREGRTANQSSTKGGSLRNPLSRGKTVVGPEKERHQN